MEKTHLNYILIGLFVINLVIAGFVVYNNNKLNEYNNNNINSINQLNQKIDEYQKSQNSFNQNLSSKLDTSIDDTNSNFDTINTQIDLNYDYLNTRIEDVNSELFTQIERYKFQSDTSLSKLQDDVDKFNDNLDVLKAKTSSDFSGIIEKVAESTVAVSSSAGIGSGAVIANDGYIVTNQHVVGGKSRVVVKTFGMDEYDADVIATAPLIDLALLKIDENLDDFQIGDEDDIILGGKVIAIGSPKGLDFSVSEGIVSAKGRQIDSTGIKYVQTDLAINRGNSGGPLINDDGKLIGINTLKISESEGLGFAIPPEVVEEFLEQVELQLNITIG